MIKITSSMRANHEVGAMALDTFIHWRVIATMIKVDSWAAVLDFTATFGYCIVQLLHVYNEASVHC